MEAQKRRPSWVVVMVLGGIVERHTAAAPEAERERRFYAMTEEVEGLVLYAPQMTSVERERIHGLGARLRSGLLWWNEGFEFVGLQESLSRLSPGPVNDDLQGSSRATGAAGWPAATNFSIGGGPLFKFQAQSIRLALSIAGPRFFSMNNS